MTAAHCVDRFQKTLMAVRIFEHDRNSTHESMTKDYRVQEIIKHGGYSTVNYNNDIALIKIDGEFEFDNKMKPVCLAERAKTFTGETGIVTGWGAIEEGGPVSTTLREVSVPIMSNADCKATKYPARKITDNMICAGYKEATARRPSTRRERSPTTCSAPATRRARRTPARATAVVPFTSCPRVCIA